MPSSAAADVIYLKNGNKIRGKVINEDPKGYLLEVPYGTMRVLRRQVAKIERESDETYLRRTGEEADIVVEEPRLSGLRVELGIGPDAIAGA